MSGNNEQYSKKTGKRKKKALKTVLITALVLVIVLVLTIGINVVINRNFTVSFYQIRSDKVSDNIRVVELSDLHNKEYGKDNCKNVEKIKEGVHRIASFVNNLEK